MINLTEKDKEFINSTEGFYSSRGVRDDLIVVQRKFGKEKVEALLKEVDSQGYNIFDKDKKERVPSSTYMALLATTKEFLNLTDDDIREMGRETAKTSLLVRFVSNILISIDSLVKNANSGWKKYYTGNGSLIVTEVDKENKRFVVELRDFTGHPAHCRHLEGFFGQMSTFVVGKSATCREEECILEGGSVHKFVVTWK